jgi:hypothetical protein
VQGGSRRCRAGNRSRQGEGVRGHGTRRADHVAYFPGRSSRCARQGGQVYTRPAGVESRRALHEYWHSP